MAVEKITYPNKSFGDLFRANEANHIKEVVNANADELKAHGTSIEQMGKALDDTLKEHKENSAKLKLLVESNVQQAFVTKAQYDALVESGAVDPAIMYNIYEE